MATERNGKAAEEAMREASAKCASTDAEAIFEEETHGRPAAPIRLQMVPHAHTKVVHFVRHGEGHKASMKLSGYHNLAGHADEANYLQEAYLDAHLTDFGWQQAAALKQHIGRQPEIKPEVIIVSPLTRALETAIGVFGGGEWHDGDKALPLMHSQDAVPNVVAAHASVSSAGCPPFLAWEGCREHLGVHPCDKRRSTEHYKESYPGIDFSLVHPGEDTWWKPTQREPGPAIKARGLEFVKWLMTRPERRIAGELQQWYENCEMRTVVLSDIQGESKTDDLWFPGGRKWL